MEQVLMNRIVERKKRKRIKRETVKRRRRLKRSRKKKKTKREQQRQRQKRSSLRLLSYSKVVLSGFEWFIFIEKFNNEELKKKGEEFEGCLSRYVDRNNDNLNFFTQKKQGKNKPLDVFIVDVKNDNDQFETFENLRMFIEKVFY
jgi:hypothetical protein